MMPCFSIRFPVAIEVQINDGLGGLEGLTRRVGTLFEQTREVGEAPFLYQVFEKLGIDSVETENHDLVRRCLAWVRLTSRYHRVQGKEHPEQSEGHDDVASHIDFDDSFRRKR